MNLSIEYPIYMRHKYGDYIVEFTALTVGRVIKGNPSYNDGRYVTGFMSHEWVGHEDKRTWEPCEKPKLEPRKPTWCWVSDNRQNSSPRKALVVRYKETGYSKMAIYVDVNGEPWTSAEPCLPDEIPEWWPKEWV